MQWMVCLVLLTSSMSVKSTASCFPALTSQVKPIPFLLRIQFASCVSLWYFLLFLPIRTQDFCFWVSIFWGCGLDTWHSWDSGAAQPHLSYWVNVTYTILQSGSSWQAFQQLHHISTTCEALEKGQNPPQIRSDSCLQLTLRFASSEVLSREAWIDGACTACETVHFIGWCIFGTAVPWAKFVFPMCLKSSAI